MPPVQNYANHRHLPRPTAVAGLLWLVAFGGFVGGALGSSVANQIGLFALAFSVFVLVAISRIYITALQDRIIKLEMRGRCERLLTPAQMAVLARLPKPQLVALRFASDEELPALLDRADRESLSADQIKRAVHTWVPDWDRT
jgi:hypothetical protein